MSYDTRAYDNEHSEPVAVLVVTGQHEVSRLISLLTGGPVSLELLQTGRKLLEQVRRHNGGRGALALLARHGGADFTAENTTVRIPGEAQE